MVEGRNLVAFRRAFFAEREPELGDKHPERRLIPRAADRAPRAQIGGFVVCNGDFWRKLSR